MPEPITAAVVSKKLLDGGDGTPGLLKRVLGPPADALGDALARWVEFRTVNVGRVVEIADRKLSARGDQAGEVPIRVGARILEEGSYCDDQVVAEYLGGVLAVGQDGDWSR